MTASDKNYKKIAVAIIKNPQGKYLIVKRKETQKSIDGSVLEWAFPGTEYNEDSRSTVELEKFISEETGYKVKPGKKISQRIYHPFGYELSYFETDLVEDGVKDYHLEKLDGFAWVDKKDFSRYFSTNIDGGLRDYLSL